MKPYCKGLLVLLLLPVLNTCSISGDEVNYHFVTLQTIAVDMPESFMLNETYDIGVTVLEPNGCTQFAGFNVTPEGTTVRNVEAIGTELVDGVCTEVITSVETSLEFICLYDETYRFRFWTGENESGEPQYLEFEVPVTP